MQEEVGVGSQRPIIVLVSASAAAGHAFREAFGLRGAVCVNVPDLTGARAVIAKVHPAVVVCDTEIDGRGSWRDLTAESKAGGGFAVLVTHSTPDEALSLEVAERGGLGILTRPLSESHVQWLLRVSGRDASAICPATMEASNANVSS